MKISQLFFLILFSIIFSNLYGQMNDIKVRIDVSCDSKGLENSINSYLTRELRDLPGIAVVDETNEVYAIRILGYNLGNSNFVISPLLVRITASEEHGKIFHALDHKLYRGELSQLRDLIKLYVATLDVEHFEPHRKELKSFKEFLKQQVK